MPDGTKIRASIYPILILGMFTVSALLESVRVTPITYGPKGDFRTDQLDMTLCQFAFPHSILRSLQVT